MDERTRTALEASIRHWERMRDNPNCGELPRGDHCPLCALNAEVDPCADCPVALATGVPACIMTPFYRAQDCFPRWDVPPNLDAWRTAAQEEIDFLRSLLPREESAS